MRPEILLNTLLRASRWEEAADLARRAMDESPLAPQWPMFLARALAGAGRFAEAMDAARAAEERAGAAPEDLAALWHALGLAALLEEAREDALQAFSRAARQAPGDPDIRLSLALTLQTLQHPQAAALEYETVLALWPDNIQARHNLILCLIEAGQTDKATEILKSWPPAGALAPERALAGAALLQAQGREEEALALWDGFLARHAPPALLEARRALAIPAVLEDAGHAARIREGLERILRKDAPGPLLGGAPGELLSRPPFHLAFHGYRDRDLLQGIAEFLQRHTSLRDLAAPPPGMEGSFARRAASLRSPRKRRVGFLSAHLANHTIMSYFFRPLMELARRLPHCVFLEPPQEDNVFRRDLAGRAPLVTLPRNLQAAQRAVLDLDLDILVHLDVGLDLFTWFLAFARLAPVQCALYGHPMTTGIPAVDVFLSPAPMEPGDAAACYSERLAALPCLLSGFLPPAPAVRAAPDRREYTQYLCCQSLFKVHPDMDRLVLDILRRDPDARAAFFVSARPEETHALQTRLAAALGGEYARVDWLAQRSEAAFMDALAGADAVLDTPHFSGGATSYKALGAGVPVVTMEGEFMRGRQTSGLYAHLDIEGLTAHGPDDYVRLALDLAHSPRTRRVFSEALLEKKDRLFDPGPSVEALEALLLGEWEGEGVL